jgi:Holliday junction resolvase RusA-like endonuclease
MELAFTVLGRAQPAGSKRAFAIRKGGVPTGQIAVVDANKNAKPWQAEVRSAALEAMWNPACGFGHGILPGPLSVSMTFYSARPKSHYGTGRNASVLKPSAPPFPAGRPDALKLARGTEDALTGVVFKDDAQVVDLRVAKRYGLPERCEIVVRYTPAIGARVAA